ncbi:hypothetical protein [Paraburkholderia hospita]|uniref:hypothetical protein n=1 Tax=Paraburkholderia hospita TaxID=169430 RepID=UPI001F60A4B5|nr:hypothetical protein [Paraburkholderia hospita]
MRDVESSSACTGAMLSRSSSRTLCGASAPGEVGLFALTLTVGAQVVSLIAHLRRVPQRRASARSRKGTTGARPPVRDPRQASLF